MGDLISIGFGLFLFAIFFLYIPLCEKV